MKLCAQWFYPRRLNPSTSYFQTLPAEINKDATPFETSCPCGNKSIPDECVTGGIPVVSFTLTYSRPVNRIKMCDSNIKPTGERKRRDIEGSDELTYEDFEVLMTPLKSNEHHREKRSVVSKDNATRYCAERLLETRVGKLCAKLGTNVQALVNVCSADIEVTFYQCSYCTQKRFETKFELKFLALYKKISCHCTVTPVYKQ